MIVVRVDAAKHCTGSRELSKELIITLGFCKQVRTDPEVEAFTVTLSNGNIFHVTGPLWGESTGHWWIPLTKTSDAKLWCFLWSEPEQTVAQTFGMPVIWDIIALIMTSL